jgi:transcriptional regulator with XRE-family HTH domain
MLLTTPKSKIAALREQAGLTQVQVAALVGVTPNTIQNWEKPNGLKQLERYLKMAELFGCKVEELVEYVPSNKDETTNKKTKNFSLEDIREVRQRWGTAARAITRSSKEENPQPLKDLKTGKEALEL